MKWRMIQWMLSVVCMVAAFSNLPEARAGVTMQITPMGSPASSLQNYLVTLASSGAPIEAIGGIQIDGRVHQVNQFSDSNPAPTAFLNSLPSDLLAYDTHLLLSQNQFSSITGSPLAETNDQSNPAGLSSPPWKFGVGTFGQGADGLMVLQSAYRSTNLDFLQVVLKNGANPYPAQVAARVVAGGVSYNVTSHDGILVDPTNIEFGKVRVGTTANGYTQAWLSEVYPTEEEDWAWRFAGPEPPFGPGDSEEGSVHLSKTAKTQVPFTFSPQSRGEFVGTGGVAGPFRVVWAGVTVSGTGVGPVFDAEQAPGTTIEFGDVPAESFFDVFFDLGNATSDGALGDLTKLTVDAAIEGDAAGAFEILSDDLLDLLAGQTDQLHLRFNAAGLTPGDYEAQLVLRTDVGAAAGATGMGEVYSFMLHGTAVPEPSALVGLIGLLMAGALSRFRDST